MKGEPTWLTSLRMRHSYISYLLVGAVISVVWCACGIVTSASPEAAPFPLNVDFPSFLARADPVYAWDSSFAGPTEWVDALFGGNGELGFYLVSDGGRTPYRLHFRRPCFIYYQAYTEMVVGQTLSDAIVTLSSMNVIAGELDA